MGRNNITYNAVFTYDTDGITITFPDFPECISCGYSRSEAMEMAKEALELCMEGYEGDMKPIPTPASEILVKEHQEIVPITI